MNVANSHTVWGLLIACATFALPAAIGLIVGTPVDGIKAVLAAMGIPLIPIFTAFFVYRGAKMGINGGTK